LAQATSADSPAVRSSISAKSMAPHHESRVVRGGQYKVERPSSRAVCSSYGPNSPEPPCAIAPVTQECHDRRRETIWYTEWENRLKLREACLEGRGVQFPKCRATPVLTLQCLSCSKTLSSHGMQLYYKNMPEVDLYSTNEPPIGVVEHEHDLNQPMCKCRLREFECPCGMVVGYRMYKRCVSCAQENDDEDGHRWFFEAERVRASPKMDPVSGDFQMWPGFDEDSSLDTSRRISGGEVFFDENSPVLPDSETPGWNLSPLADRNGRTRASLGKPIAGVYAKRDAELTQKEADLVAKEQALQQCKIALDAQEMQLRDQVQQAQQGADDATKRALNRAEQNAAICEAEAESLRLQLEEQKSLAMNVEEKLAAKNQEIQQLQALLAEVRREVRKNTDGRSSIMGRGRLPQLDEASIPLPMRKQIQEMEQELTCEKVELAAVRLELQQANQRLEGKDAELERILPQIVASRVQGSQHPNQKDAEIDRLRRELDSTRKELLQLRPESLRSESERVHAAPSTMPPKSKSIAVETDDREARLAMAMKLSEKRHELDLREQAMAAREASMVQGAWGDGIRPLGGAIGGFFERIGCIRRQSPVGYTGRLY